MILKIDSTEGEIKVTLFDKDNKKDELKIKQKLGSQALLPLIVAILKKNKINLEDLSEVKVNPGPGSFTGSRVGVSVANALGFALNIPVNNKQGKIVVPKYAKSKFDE